MNAIQELGAYYKQCTAIELPSKQKKRFELRASSLPFCALRLAYRKYNYINKEDEKHNDTFGMDFFTKVGTVAHEVFQRYMGAGGRMVGDWKCTCGYERKFSTKNICRKCGSEMEYVELTVAIGKHFTGHIDGVYKAKDGRYYVIDYKTSMMKNVWAKPSPFPYFYNVSQIKAYCAIVEKTHDIEIAGWMLLYIARDNPFSGIKIAGSLISRSGKERNLEKVLRYDRHFGYLQKGLTRKTLKILIDEKPCTDYEMYEKEYAGHNPCELAPVCFGSCKGLYAATRHLIEEEQA